MSGISNYNFTASSFKADTLTENRVVFVNSEGTLIDNANLLFNNNILATDSILLASENDGTLKINDVSGTNTVGKSLTISSGRSTGTATGGNIIFETTEGTETGTSNNILKSRMTILNSGNVGIGTNSPTSKLHVEGGCTISNGISFEDVNGYSWTQTGSNISGEANGDYFAACIDINLDASLLIIGGYMHSGKGHARVFEYNVGSNTWIQKGNDIDGEASGDYSGLNVSISNDGNFISSGAPFNASGGVDAGHVKIYKWNGSSWGGTGYQWEIVGVAGSNFGFTNQLNQDGNRIVIGGWKYQSDKGILEVYELSDNTWSKMGISLTGNAEGDEFGKWAQINGNGTIIAVGSPGSNGLGTNRGNVKVYEWNGSAWQQKGSTIVGTADQDKLGERFGISLSRSGLILAISSSTNDSGRGYVKIYQWDSGSSDWVQLGSTLVGSEGSRFGSGISINEDGTNIVIGAFAADDETIDTGQTKVYNWDGAAWNQRGGNIDGSTIYDYSGTDVRINSDGSRIVITSPQIIGNANGSQSGLVKAYNLQKTINTTTITGSSSLSSDITFTLPSNTGTNGQVLSTNGSGNLSWVTSGSTIDGLIDAKSGGDNFSNSIILGHQTTGTLSTASNNTALGFGTIVGITSGDNNTAIGYNAGNTITSGTENTLLGSGTSTTASNSTNQTAIGFGTSCSGDNEVSLGNNSVTTLRCATAAIASLSDRRDKKDIIDCQYGLDFVEKLRPVQFTWNRRVLDNSDINNPNNGKKRLGFIAQDFQDAMPNGENEILDLVNEVNPDRIEAKYANLIPILTKSIQELQRKIISLERQLMNK